mmetsp:Transcript_37787/g.117443  ORF Transcript_37787/g.117443 Transcript_37787/m.117443 type:complete len:316 (-) Transcript_37787:60-1007(-)
MEMETQTHAALYEAIPKPCSCGGHRTPSTVLKSDSLNSDPYNLRSEELAIAECTRGVDVRRVWSEREMVRSFGGRMSPGTPDGMFEDWDGALTCVQVVRVPLVAGMSPECMCEALAQTILTKVVKSQQWLRVCHASPCDFVIFCWLPFSIPNAVADSAEVLMQRVRVLDLRFSLRLRVPAEAGELFPARFAYVHPSRKGSSRGSASLLESDVTAYTGSDEEDEEEDCAWDITWAWELDCCGVQEVEQGEEEEASSAEQGDVTDDCGGLESIGPSLQEGASEMWQVMQQGGAAADQHDDSMEELTAQALALWDDNG